MIKQFKTFLTTTNALALAVGVIIGAATGKLVTAVVTDLLMPVISLIIPSGDWRSAEFVLRTTTGPDGKPVVTSLKYGDFVGTVVDFLIIAYVVFLIVKIFIPKKPEAPAAATKTCPQCLETIPSAATRCKFCTSNLGGVLA